MSVEKHLNKLEITVEQANNFISANINDPEKLFVAASDNAVTTDMLRKLQIIQQTLLENILLLQGLTVMILIKLILW
ncbi:MAG: hypothetical protein IPH22_01615 [Nitrosomonas sp.]|nr:hypothetical protein [Nitrosomonas sp.]